MSSVYQRAGKTVPRFVADLALYDPDRPPASGRNLLSEVPPVFQDGYDGPPEVVSQSACNHSYVTKTNQTFLIPSGHHRTPRGTTARVAVVCSRCRYHVQVVVNNTGSSTTPLPDHLHHLVYQSGRQRNGPSFEEITPKGQRVETFHYVCSHSSCSTAVSVRMVSPVLGPHMVELLTNPALIETRANEAIKANPQRYEGVQRPLPITVLENLRTYIHNALYERHRSRVISATNRRFAVCFGTGGQPCKDLLEFLDFRYQAEGFWVPPQPAAGPTAPLQDELSIFLDDVIHELSSLIDQRPPHEKKTPYSLTSASSSSTATQNLLYALEAENYPKAPRRIEFSLADEPCYEDLGTVEDMSTELIIEAYKSQVATDPARARHYFRCLKKIGDLRGGPDREMIEQAANNMDDETLNRIFLGEESKEDKVSTVQEAYVFLGVDETTSDDFVITMYTAKINDSPSSKPLAQQAVSLIAEARNSETLRHYLATGETGQGEMDVGDAYRLLQIPDRTVDDDAILAAYTICIEDAPDQIETYNRALGIIAREKNSPLLSNYVSGSSVQQPDRDVSRWPVGLQNIGNTCYLNSLLQFYFTIRPYRELVLDFENHKTDLDDPALEQKKVGSRKVSKAEVERSQRFLRELRTLFYNMITTPNSSVRPEQELARLTLISSTNEAAIRRRSTVSAKRPVGGLGEINGLPVAGPLGPPQVVQPADENQPEAPGPAPGEGTKESAMDTTPDGEQPKVQADAAGEYKENQDAPIKQDRADEATAETSRPVEEVSETPPPVPPRPSQSEAERRRQLLEEVELGAQQDVTEVINNVLFQSECAIKARELAPDGEQLDQIKDLFYGRTKSYISAKSGVRSKEELWSDIKIDVASGSRDIYSAIDGAFDMQKVVVEGELVEQYGSISKLPPVLQIQVQRVQFDPIKKTPFKSTHFLELKETIYLDRYMDTQKPELLQRRRQTWEWKEEIRQLEARRAELLRTKELDGKSMPDIFKATSRVLEDLENLSRENGADCSLDIRPELSSEVEQLALIGATELDYIGAQVQQTRELIAEQFADSRYLAYRLYAVFMHQGTAEFGHYYIYIFDFTANVWRKYNDNEITEVHDPAEVLGRPTNSSGASSSNPPTPYFVVYVNDALKERLVQPVCREVAVPVPPPPAASGKEEEESRPPEDEKTGGGDPMDTLPDQQVAADSREPEPVPLPSYDEAWVQSEPLVEKPTIA